MAGSTQNAGRQAAALVNENTLKKIGRVGVAALGVVYLLLAWLSAQVALGGGGGEKADNTGALAKLAGSGGGKLLLGVLLVGFVAYTFWQALEAVAGYQSRQGGERMLERVKCAAKAVLGAALAITCFRFLTGSSQKSSSSQQETLTGKLLNAPAGQILVVAAGLVVIVIACYIGYRGYTRSFLEKLEGTVDRRVELLGVVGYFARAVVFGLLGVLVVIAGVTHDKEKSGGLDQALRTLAGQPYGTALLLVVALGLAAFGVYELITARQAKEG
jgi:membrane protease YdiL (CAAX protease family)